MQALSKEIESKLSLLPDQPGVYLWKDKNGTIIYIGKALNLKHRVRSYFASSGKDVKTEHLVKNIADLEYIITNSESDAFILEATLIKHHRPKYNIMLKDDKRYPFVKITVNEPFPRIFITRELLKDDAKYFGPYTEVRYLRSTLRDLEWIFPLRSCNRNIPKTKYKQPCMNYQLGKCPAPCVGCINQKDYAVIVNRLLRFFSGRYTELIDELRAEMQNASDSLDFEEAAKLRDRIVAIQSIQKRQSVFNVEGGNTDIIGFYREEKRAVCVVFKMQNGAIIHQENYPLANLDYEESDSILASFLQLYYADKEEMPDEVLLPFAPKDIDKLNSWLENKLQVPQRGGKTKLIAMAKRNAFKIVEDIKLAHLIKANRTIFPIQELKEVLKLPKLPRKIVCMDISTIQGSDTVSSAVFFENGKSKKKYYRHFIIRSIDTQNDFAAMQETMARFLTETEKDEQMKPDLIIVDGGKGQLSASEQILNSSGKNDISLIALAKRAEEVYLSGNEQSIVLPRSSSALRLLITIRDEAHRFAITFHRKRRTQRTLESALEAIPGIAETNKFLLLKELGSIDNIAKADIETLSSIKGIGIKTATKIYNHFHNEENK